MVGADSRGRPSGEVIAAYSDKVRFRARRQKQYDAMRDKPAVTRDGVRISLNMNAGLLVDMPHLAESGADGIGLFRTELQFMLSQTFPRLDRQIAAYRAVLAEADGKPVVFRSLDIGGDKVLPYLRRTHEENPALGWRAIRMSLDRTGLFRTQVRAFLRAAEGRELRIMIPMVSAAFEMDAVRVLVDKEVLLLERRGYPKPRSLRVGAMIEVPSVLYELDQLLPKVDFVSVGSNDLMQFLFAADRANLGLDFRQAAAIDQDRQSRAVHRLSHRPRCGQRQYRLVGAVRERPDPALPHRRRHRGQERGHAEDGEAHSASRSQRFRALGNA